MSTVILEKHENNSYNTRKRKDITCCINKKVFHYKAPTATWYVIKVIIITVIAKKLFMRLPF